MNESRDISGTDFARGLERMQEIEPSEAPVPTLPSRSSPVGWARRRRHYDLVPKDGIWGVIVAAVVFVVGLLLVSHR
ncbi:MAG TPA: hypothetical protein VMF06_20605 [Candidatus Limnocylindria bacterium]|jgi:hypothetical protein|nr:hypothetical protein [Candidatus Limnocylindria bacterium]